MCYNEFMANKIIVIIINQRCVGTFTKKLLMFCFYLSLCFHFKHILHLQILTMFKITAFCRKLNLNQGCTTQISCRAQIFFWHIQGPKLIGCNIQRQAKLTKFGASRARLEDSAGRMLCIPDLNILIPAELRKWDGIFL